MEASPTPEEIERLRASDDVAARRWIEVRDSYIRVGFTKEEAFMLTLATTIGQSMPRPAHLMDMADMMRGVLREAAAGEDES